jgi:hypothetical protein
MGYAYLTESPFDAVQLIWIKLITDIAITAVIMTKPQNVLTPLDRSEMLGKPILR